MQTHQYKTKGIGGHQGATMKSDEYLTPREIISRLGVFDLDPATPILRPWDTAKKHYNKLDDGLTQSWDGRVWLNPPYGNELKMWLHKMAVHNNGIALTFARLETTAFRDYVHPVATTMLAIYGRLTFYKNIYGIQNGVPVIEKTVPCKGNSGGPSVLIAYGEKNSEILENCGIPGKHMFLNAAPLIVVGFSSSWKMVIKMAITRLDGQAEVQAIYEVVERIASDKVSKNPNYKEKIRQRLQQHFVRIKRGVYALNKVKPVN